MTTLREIQAKVGVTPDGIIGPRTLDAIADALGMTVSRRPSADIIKFVRQTEALAKERDDGRIEAYMPTPDDVPTIGYGSTGPDIVMGLVWTVAQCEARFAQQFAQFADSVDSLLGEHETTAGQFDAMVSLAYNIGVQALRESTLLRMHLAGDYEGTEAQFARWNKQKGKVLRGLTIRRAAEAKVYHG